MAQIKKVKRKDLDIEKYSNALNTSINYRVYAEHWYLDVLTDEKWECLVYGDYEVIMPIPLQYKLGVKFVLQPIYCQQLGVFYKEPISEELFKHFKEKLYKYRVRVYHFNEENVSKFEIKGASRVNHLLDLNHDFSEIFKNFERDRKKDFRRNEKLNLKIIEELNIDEFFEIYKLEYKELGKVAKEDRIRLVIEKLMEKNQFRAFTLKNAENKTIAISFFIISKHRMILLYSVRNKSIETKGAFAYLMSSIIEKFSKKNLILDFEGSNLKGIADFNESFGAKKHYYISYSNLPNIKSFTLKK